MGIGKDSNHNQRGLCEQSGGHSCGYWIGTVHIGTSETTVGVMNKKRQAFTEAPFPTSRWSEVPARLAELLLGAHIEISRINMTVTRDTNFQRSFTDRDRIALERELAFTFHVFVAAADERTRGEDGSPSDQTLDMTLSEDKIWEYSPQVRTKIGAGQRRKLTQHFFNLRD